MIIDQLFIPKPLKEANPYNLPGKDYDRPGDTPRRPRPQGDTSPRRHPDDPDFMDPDQVRLRADQARVAKANAEYQAKKKKPVNEAILMEDPIYRNFKRVGQYIAEQKLTEPEILQIFSDAEAGMTDRATGANRTFLGRGKDTTMDFAGGVKDAVSGVLDSIQTSVPVAAVDVAYDQATDALANLTGGQKGAAMEAIKKYRNLVKQYPKTAGFAKAALVAIAGLATGGAGLPAIAGLTYALDSAIKGDKLSSVIGKGAGTAALAAAGQAAFGSAPADASEVGALAPDSFTGTPVLPPELATYTVQPGDTLSQIAQDNNTSVQELVGLNPQLAAASGATGGQNLNPDVIFPGQEITLPTGTPGTDVYAGGVGTSADTMADIAKGNVPNSPISQAMAAKGQAAAGGRQFDLPAADAAQNAAVDAQVRADYADAGPAEKAEILKTTGMTADQLTQLDSPKIDYTKPGPESVDSMGQKLEYGMPVNDRGSFIPPNPQLPPEELAKQTAAYNSWLADFMKRFPNATQLPNGEMQAFKPGLAPMFPGMTPKAFESVKFKIIPANRLIDQKATVLNWALNESVGRRSQSVNLTTIGTLTVFENVDRYRRAIVEYTQPGREQIPNLLRPDMPGAPVTPDPNPGMIGRGLNALDRFTSRVGGGLSNFGRQFTTGVTKEKLKMNWHQAGKPTDSDQLAAWLVTQKVPQQVVTDVFSKMGIPYTAPTTQPTAQPADQTDAQATAPAKTGGGQTALRYGINPVNGKPFTASELRNRASARRAPATVSTGTDTSTAATTTAQQGGGYKSVTYAPNIKTGANLPKPTAPAATVPTNTGGTGTATTPDVAAAYNASLKAGKPASIPKSTATPKTMGMRRTNVKKPTATNVTSTYGPGFKNSNQPAVPKEDPQAETKKAIAARQAAGLGAYESKTNGSRILQALKRPVAEMLQMVETKEDVQRIKQFVDETFVRYGAVNESAFAVRNQILEHVTQVGAQRRREHSQRVAH